MTKLSTVPYRAALCVLVVTATPAAAQTKPAGWSATANLSGVATAGNTSTSSFGAKLRLDRSWLRTLFYAEGAGVYQNAEQGSRFAVGSTDAFTVVDETERVKKAENYYADFGFERRITEQLFWTVGGGWKRDVFSGVDRQLSARGGIGYMRSRQDQELKVGVDATYTDETDVVLDPVRENPFFGGRLVAEWLRKFGDGQRSQFQSKAALDQNLQTTDDTRLHWENALTVNITQRLGLQLGYTLEWRNRPAFEEIAVYAQPPLPGASSNAKVTAPLEKMDHTLQASVVINWSRRPPSVAKPTP